MVQNRINMEKQRRKVVHLEIKELKSHEYFGSFSAMFKHHSVEDIGYSLTTLQNQKTIEGTVIENQKVVIRIGRLN